MNITVTETAIATLKNLLAKDETKQSVYVYLAGVGCGGGGTASYSLAPVEQKEGENTIEMDGITFIYDNLMLKHTKNILIDYKPSAYGTEIWLQNFMIKDVK
ncbi:iron-sulfur cluster biosynthesis family protein [Bacillus benzoevorans]|uniref:Fe-S cluster assembly iron-binding protein IscA n=1 Tax=Bacillus benzoevorans TaxID=1456 RepID=A0A7X0HVP3_9BACI|nr:iron-sulfur cluster biosynthesis family protein [Bacillus benzoevorans]MBB6447714.1 Fe-S cluster assembly iron-binding protein IscA [Bacillus benzoevorans]